MEPNETLTWSLVIPILFAIRSFWLVFGYRMLWKTRFSNSIWYFVYVNRSRALGGEIGSKEAKPGWFIIGWGAVDSWMTLYLELIMMYKGTKKILSR